MFMDTIVTSTERVVTRTRSNRGFLEFERFSGGMHGKREGRTGGWVRKGPPRRSRDEVRKETRCVGFRSGQTCRF